MKQRAGDLSVMFFKLEALKRLEDLGVVAPGCPARSCRERYAAVDPLTVGGEPHTASVACESGHRNHCTCDRCF